MTMRMPWHLIVVVLALAGILALMAWPAFAHDHWINHGDYQDPVNHWRCCGDSDCEAVEPEAVKSVTGGWLLPDGEIIPYARTIISEDQHDYICRWGSPMGNGSRVRCLFIAPPGS